MIAIGSFGAQPQPCHLLVFHQVRVTVLLRALLLADLRSRWHKDSPIVFFGSWEHHAAIAVLRACIYGAVLCPRGADFPAPKTSLHEQRVKVHFLLGRPIYSSFWPT